MSGSRFPPYRLLLVLILLLVSSLYTRAGSAEYIEPPSGPLLRLRLGAFDPLAAPLPQIAGLEQPDLDPYAPALRIVQFPGPIQDAWLEALQAAGLEIVAYLPDYAYLVWGKAGGVERLALAAPLRWRGDYLPEFALHPDLAPLLAAGRLTQAPPQAPALDDKAPEMVEVFVQVVDRPETAAVIAAILDAAQAVIRPPAAARSTRTLALALPAGRLAWLAAQPGVINVAPYPRYRLHDEVQGQIMAGSRNAAGSGPGSPGYRAWLAGRGFSTQPGDYPIIDITDDGIDSGSSTPMHPDFYTLGDPTRPDRLVYNHNWTYDPLPDSQDGHGTLNASIAGGYNSRPGAYRDPAGYQRGLGINPFGRLAGSKVFRNTTNTTGGWGLTVGLSALIENSYTLGARISSNSWGSADFGDYNADDQLYDLRVRDALPSQPGNQELVIVFSAGNDGYVGGSTGSPGNAKNVLTVGASESYRPQWENIAANLCPTSLLDTDDLEDVAAFSSRGPTDDLRIKPDLVAPGTMITGAASQAAGYDGQGVCVSFYPGGQTLYAASSGTSHSAPAVAGAASLLDYFYRANFGGVSPSPAMVKAYLVSSTHYLSGDNAGDSLPSPSQGFGLVDLGRAFDDTPRFLLDQQALLGESGELYEMQGTVFDPKQPLRVTLAWTDAPGSTVGAAYVNDLNLEVEIGGQTYLGNVFNGAHSRSGGTADPRNNVESVFLPPGAAGEFTVRVRAANLPGDGVPGNADISDQDFALVVYNAEARVGALSGVVRAQPDGQGLPGAAVRALSPSGRTLQTAVDAGGAYSLTLWANTYILQAWKYGYELQTVGDVSITDGGQAQVDFDLSPVGSYTFHTCITDAATGQGLEAGVSILGPFGDEVLAAGAAAGEHCLTLDLPQGQYTVRVSSRLHYPAEAPLNLIQNVRQDFPLEAETTDGLIYGQVSDHVTGLPLAGADVRLEPGDRRARTAGNGRYEILAPAGVYTQTVTAALYQPVSAPVELRQSNLTQSSFALAAPLLQLSRPGAALYALDINQAISLTVRLQNNGDAPLRFSATERADGVPAGGGPESGGYLVQDSQLSSEVQYAWVDAGEGYRLALSDDGEVEVELPFAFPFFGQLYDRILVGNNGAAGFDPTFGDFAYLNPDLSLLDAPVLAPFWDDLDDERGYVAVRTAGVAPQRRFVIEWKDRPHFNDVGAASFQAILYESSGNIKFQYQDVFFEQAMYDRGASATIGLRGPGQALLQVSLDQATRGNGSALCFQAPGEPPCDPVDLPWLVVSPAAGLLAPGESQDLTLWVDAAQAGGLGYFPGGVRLFTSDPHSQPYVDIPAGLLLIPNAIHLPLTLR